MKWSLIKRKLARVDKAIDKAIERAEIPGAVVLARMPREGEVIEHLSVRGLAVVRPERIPMRRDTIFDLASLTKPMATTTGILLLVADGAIGLDDPVAKVLPAFAEREKQDVTFRQLLTHCAGLKPWRPFHELLIQKERKSLTRLVGTPEGRDWILDRIIRSGLVHQPGEATVYGDLDFIVLGAAIEEVAKQPLDVFCAERIFGPLGLEQTRFLPLTPDGAEEAAVPEALRRRIAATENCPWRERILWGEVHDPNAFAMGGVAGHAGLFSTADDVMRFAQTWLDVWHGRSDLLPRELVVEFCRKQQMQEDSDWALGWDTPTEGLSSSGQHFSPASIGHLGFTGTSIWVDLEREAIVVMLANRVHQVAKRSKFELRPNVHDLVMQGFFAGLEPKPAPESPAQPGAESDQAELAMEESAAGGQVGEAPAGASLSAADLERVHFIAIGGSGMGSLAGLLKARGLAISGSDKALYPPMSDALERWEIPVVEGFAPENVLGEPRPDLVVIGNAVWRDNAEAQAAIDAGLPYRSFSDALYELAMAERHPVVVSGTHGKTTTTNLTAALLQAAGRDPSLLVGGISLDFDGSFREGQGEHFVVEGDEYDTAFFDKTPKFLHYHPRTLILTSVEFDHADIYRDLEHVKSAFRELVAGMPEDGVIVAAWGDSNVREVVADAPCRVVGYAAADASDAAWTAVDIQADEDGTQLRIVGPEGASASARLPMHGRINVENALGAVVAVVELGVALDEAVRGLAGVKGVKRRQEVRGEVRGVTVIDDFAHHPTAVAGAIEALRMRYPGRRLLAVFEPRTNTSRRAVFQDDYARSFDAADRVILRRVPDEPIYSATGEVTERLSADALADAIRARDVETEVFDDVDPIVSRLAEVAQQGDVVLVMSNGAFDGIWEKLLAALRA